MTDRVAASLAAVGRAASGWATWALCMVIALSWALTIGRYGGPDEPAHVVRAAAVARGVLLGDPADELEPGYRLVEVPRSIASGDPACYRHDARVDASCAVASPLTDDVAAATSAGTFPPVYYAAVGVVARIAGVGHDALGHRVVAATLVALVLAVAYRRLLTWPDRTRAGLVWAGITPAAWFLTGVVNTNGVEIALFVLAWVLAAELLGAADPAAGTASDVTVDAPMARHLLALGTLGALVIVLRPVAAIGVLVVAATLAAGLATTRRPGWRSRPVTGAVVIVGAAAVSVAAWWGAAGLVVRDSRTVAGSDEAVVGAALRGIDDTLVEAVRSLGWAEHTAPFAAVLIWCAFAGIALTAVALGGDGRLRRATIVWAVVTLAAPVVFEVMVARRIGLVWQGRYSIGALLGLGALGAVALPERLRWAARVAPLLAAAASTCTLWAAARRYMSGVDGPWWPGRRSGWWPPIGPWWPLAAHAVAALVLALGLTGPRCGAAITARTAAP